MAAVAGSVKLTDIWDQWTNGITLRCVLKHNPNHSTPKVMVSGQSEVVPDGAFCYVKKIRASQIGSEKLVEAVFDVFPGTHVMLSARFEALGTFAQPGEVVTGTIAPEPKKEIDYMAITRSLAGGRR